MQRDSGTYCDEPTDLEDFAKWQETFDFQKHEVRPYGSVAWLRRGLFKRRIASSNLAD